MGPNKEGQDREEEAHRRYVKQTPNTAAILPDTADMQTNADVGIAAELSRHRPAVLEAAERSVGVAMLEPTHMPVRIARSEIHGNGVFALWSILPGCMVGLYTGRITTDIEHPKSLQIEDDRGAHYAILGDGALSFLNHSDDPNAEADGAYIYATELIKPGEEILISYDPEGETSFAREGDDESKLTCTTCLAKLDPDEGVKCRDCVADDDPRVHEQGEAPEAREVGNPLNLPVPGLCNVTLEGGTICSLPVTHAGPCAEDPDAPKDTVDGVW